MNINYCPICGEELTPNANFCPNCGENFNKEKIQIDAKTIISICMTVLGIILWLTIPLSIFSFIPLIPFLIGMWIQATHSVLRIVLFILDVIGIIATLILMYGVAQIMFSR